MMGNRSKRNGNLKNLLDSVLYGQLNVQKSLLKRQKMNNMEKYGKEEKSRIIKRNIRKGGNSGEEEKKQEKWEKKIRGMTLESE